MAVNPASVMREFFDTFLSSSAKVLLLIALLVTVVAGASIMTTIYNSVSARRREIAILRALGATKGRILSLICIEAALVGLFGGILGFIAGHLLGAAGSIYMNKLVGEGLNWTAVGGEEWIYLGAVVVMAGLAGLVPGLKAYRTPVATNLVAG
jgi:putative ABC transport system permease protein